MSYRSTYGGAELPDECVVLAHAPAPRAKPKPRKVSAASTPANPVPAMPKPEDVRELLQSLVDALGGDMQVPKLTANWFAELTQLVEAIASSGGAREADLVPDLLGENVRTRHVETESVAASANMRRVRRANPIKRRLAALQLLGVRDVSRIPEHQRDVVFGK